MDVIGMIVSIFCMFDPVGNIPIVMPLVKDCTPKRQRIVILRECSIALCVIILFLFSGKHILNGLGIAIISTSKGLMTDKEARKNNLGGEVLAYIW